MLLSSVAAYRMLVGTNIAALCAMKQGINDKMQKGFGFDKSIGQTDIKGRDGVRNHKKHLDTHPRRQHKKQKK